MKTEQDKLKSELNQFIGTTQYHPSTFGALKITDGVNYLREAANCYWLIDLIESYNMCHNKVQNMGFQLWNLTVNENRSAYVFCREDTKKRPVVTQKVHYTDFPLNEIKLYCIDKTVLLPSEY